MGKKQVGFYRPVIVDEKENRIEINDPDFWAKAHSDIATLPFIKRRTSVNAAPFHGEAGVGMKLALKYIRLGRVRTAADWPDTIDDGQESTAPLVLPTGRNLFESAYIVPFGTINRIAFMGPMRGIVTIRSAEMWLGAMLGLPEKGHRLELLPEVDELVTQKLLGAEGVTRLAVRVPAGSNLELPQGNPTGAEAALERAVAAADDQLSAEIVLSAGHGRASAKMRSQLKRAAQRFLRTGGVDKLEVTWTNEDEDTKRLKSETHDLLRDIITATATFDVDDHAQLAIDDILEGMQQAITTFQKGS